MPDAALKSLADWIWRRNAANSFCFANVGTGTGIAVSFWFVAAEANFILDSLLRVESEPPYFGCYSPARKPWLGRAFWSASSQAGRSAVKKKAASRLQDFQLAADGADCALLDFAMPWNRRDFTVGRVFPDGVVPAFANQRGAMGAEMALQVEPFHEAAS